MLLFVGDYDVNSTNQSPDIIMIISFILFCFILYKFVRFSLLHKKRVRRFQEWSKFHEQLKIWSEEIVDKSLQNEFINEYQDLLVGNESLYNGSINWSVNEEKMRIYQKWGKHIPSLLQEVRNEKLNHIL